MIRVTIDLWERTYGDFTEQEFMEQLKARKADRENICVKVHFKLEDVDVFLATPGCAGGGGGRAPNGKEQEIIDKWKRLHLSEPNWAPGNLLAFLKQVDHQYA